MVICGLGSALIITWEAQAGKICDGNKGNGAEEKGGFPLCAASTCLDFMNSKWW